MLIRKFLAKKNIIRKSINYFFLNKNVFLCFLILIFISLILLNISYSAVDFGKYTDDIRRINTAKIFFENKRFLPEMYDYPSITFLISFFSQIFYHWSEFKLIGVGDFIHFATIDSTRENLTNFKLYISYDEILFIRKVFVTFCILNIWFIFFSLIKLNLNPISIFFGSLVIPLSFEFWARSRFIAADALVVTFCSAVILSTILFFQKKKFNYLYLCALFCAFATSSKYTAGILILIPIILVILFKRHNNSQLHLPPPPFFFYGLCFFLMHFIF
jgi:hypothetical protein